MKRLKKMSVALLVCAFILASYVQKVQAPTESMKTFFESEIPGIRIQVNATTETQPAANITVVLSLEALTNVYVENFNLSVYGFVYGKEKILMANMTANNFPLNNGVAKDCNITFNVPENAWDVTYGEVRLTYSANLGGLELTFPQITCGFTMTYVKNTYLEKLENDLKTLIEKFQRLNATYWQLNDTFEWINQSFWECFQMNLSEDSLAHLNQTYWELQQNYTLLKTSMNELENTRRVTMILGVTTVFFVATTVYLVTRKPKEIW